MFKFLNDFPTRGLTLATVAPKPPRLETWSQSKLNHSLMSFAMSSYHLAKRILTKLVMAHHLNLNLVKFSKIRNWALPYFPWFQWAFSRKSWQLKQYFSSILHFRPFSFQKHIQGNSQKGFRKCCLSRNLCAERSPEHFSWIYMSIEYIQRTFRLFISNNYFQSSNVACDCWFGTRGCGLYRWN